MEKNSVEIEELKYFGILGGNAGAAEREGCVWQTLSKPGFALICLKMEKNSVEIEELKYFGGEMQAQPRGSAVFGKAVKTWFCTVEDMAAG